MVEIRPAKREAVFRLKGDRDGARAVIPYDILHVAPPQTTPDFVRLSPLVDAQGWVKVDKHTMQNPDFPNVFALGDVAGTPNAKTGASACKQAPAMVSNLVAAMRGDALAARYEGYVACPIVTAYGRMLLCEFDYSGKPTPTLPLIGTFRERYDMWLLKRYGLPWIYWHLDAPRAQRAVPPPGRGLRVETSAPGPRLQRLTGSAARSQSRPMRSVYGRACHSDIGAGT